MESGEKEDCTFVAILVEQPTKWNHVSTTLARPGRHLGSDVVARVGFTLGPSVFEAANGNGIVPVSPNALSDNNI